MDRYYGVTAWRAPSIQARAVVTFRRISDPAFVITVNALPLASGAVLLA